MKKLGILLILLVLTSLLSTVSAHYAETDQNFEIEIHVDPDDKPVARQNTMIYFTLNKSPAGFKWEHCLCNLSITKDGTEVFYDSEMARMKSEYTFYEGGTYVFTLSGEPKDGSDFDPFTVSHEYVVTEGQTIPTSVPLPPKADNGFAQIGYLLLILTGLIGSAVMLGKKQKKGKT